ncbi:MAG TPA: thioredoxin family protein [Devosia sp.]|uniref:TlpA family protein disulfide reductase n=1 Tax=Devosia sp. TaxID=1871048 RepID=UPI002DDD5AA9|nr:thioredoxin family protein [Devosia sp.]HEV2515290.1 thioredoxin family protein [Devosia sp.]
MRPLLRLLLTCLLLLLPIAIAPAFAEEAVTAAPASQVLSYEGDAQLAELAAKGTTVVFFYAAWCPNCRATVTELNARWDEVNPGLTLVIADYDKEQALKARFGVTYQDTFVLLDKDGKGVEVWNSGGVNGLNAHTSAL